MEKQINGQISVEDARKLQLNWIDNQAKILKSGLGYEDCRDFLFKLEELQDYLDLVREKSREQGIANPGIRIFFGAYPEGKEGTATVFLAATKDTGTTRSGGNIDDNETVENNDEIPPLNTVKGGFPPTDI